jgi:hypothetical protein
MMLGTTQSDENTKVLYHMQVKKIIHRQDLAEGAIWVVIMPSESVLQCTNDVGLKLLFSLYIKKYLICSPVSHHNMIKEQD